MIDRHGKNIYVGWDAHEILWLEAALQLPKWERSGAYQDIAEMTGRSFASVQAKGEKVASELRLAAAMASGLGTILVPARAHPRPRVLPSDITPPKLAKLMGRRA